MRGSEIALLDQDPRTDDITIENYEAVERCFANRNGTRCKIMQSEICEGVCAFFKTKKAFKQDRALAFTRIAGLPSEHQSCIADKYFHGKWPWNNQA